MRYYTLVRAVWDLDIPQNEKLVLLAYADYADDDNTASPGLGSIVRQTGYSEPSVKRIRRALLARGVLVVVEMGGNGPGSTSTVRIVPEAGPQLPERVSRTNPLPSFNPVTGDPLPKSKEVASDTHPSNEGVTGDPLSASKGVVAMTPEVTTTSRVERGGSRRRPETPLPETWRPNRTHREKAYAARLDLDDEAERFRLYADENDRRARNWDAAFTRWLMNAVRFASERNSNGGRRAASGDSGFWGA